MERPRRFIKLVRREYRSAGGNIMAPLLPQMPWFPFLKRLLLSKEKALLARHRDFFSIQ